MVADRLSTCLLLHLVAQQLLEESNVVGAALCYFVLVSVELVSHGVVMLMSELGKHRSWSEFSVNVIHQLPFNFYEPYNRWLPPEGDEV